jgi:hypothetical protein
VFGEEKTYILYIIITMFFVVEKRHRRTIFPRQQLLTGTEFIMGAEGEEGD